MELKHFIGQNRQNCTCVLIVPFMELKPHRKHLRRKFVAVLIVPFMELKPHRNHLRRKFVAVLIVPFMELKLCCSRCHRADRRRLNRTFYGIETGFEPLAGRGERPVLIVPFMELKLSINDFFLLKTVS